MSYFVSCTFDLKNASPRDYAKAYSELAKIGLTRVLVSSKGNKISLPNTVAVGEFSGTSAGALRDDLSNRIKAVFVSCGFDSEIFVTVGGDWAWGHRVT